MNLSLKNKLFINQYLDNNHTWTKINSNQFIKRFKSTNWSAWWAIYMNWSPAQAIIIILMNNQRKTAPVKMKQMKYLFPFHQTLFLFSLFNTSLYLLVEIISAIKNFHGNRCEQESNNLYENNLLIKTKRDAHMACLFRTTTPCAPLIQLLIHLNNGINIPF